MYLCGQFCGWGNFQKYWKTVSDWISFPKTNMQGEKRALDKENIYKPQLFWVRHVGFLRCWRELISSYPKQNLLSLCCSSPSQQIQATIWASNIIITQMCFVSDTVLIPFTFDYYVLKSCKWSIQFEQRWKQTMKWHSAGHTDWFLHRDPYNGSPKQTWVVS